MMFFLCCVACLLRVWTPVNGKYLSQTQNGSDPAHTDIGTSIVSNAAYVRAEVNVNHTTIVHINGSAIANETVVTSNAQEFWSAIGRPIFQFAQIALDVYSAVSGLYWVHKRFVGNGCSKVSAARCRAGLQALARRSAVPDEVEANKFVGQGQDELRIQMSEELSIIPEGRGSLNATQKPRHAAMLESPATGRRETSV